MPAPTPGYVGPAGSGYASVPASSPDVVTITAGTGSPLDGAWLAGGSAEDFAGNTDTLIGWANSTAWSGGGPGSVSPASPTLPSGAAIDAIIWDQQAAILGVVTTGTQAQNYFTSLAFTNKSSVPVTYDTASALYFEHFLGTTIWLWALASQPFTVSDNYACTFT